MHRALGAGPVALKFEPILAFWLFGLLGMSRWHKGERVNVACHVGVTLSD